MIMIAISLCRYLFKVVKENLCTCSIVNMHWPIWSSLNWWKEICIQLSACLRNMWTTRSVWKLFRCFFEIVCLCVYSIVQVYVLSPYSYTPLMEAAREGHEDVVALLIDQGSNQYNSWLILVLYWLICSGANINAQTDETQETALTLACCGGFLEVVQLLAEKGWRLCCALVHVCVKDVPTVVGSGRCRPPLT